jgi:hypothetical protein
MVAKLCHDDRLRPSFSGGLREARRGLVSPLGPRRSFDAQFVVESRAICFVREGGLEPPRCYPLAPQASASTNSATRAGM